MDTPHKPNLPESKRPKRPTPLSEWLLLKKMSKNQFAKRVGISLQCAQNIAVGRSLPGLIMAFKIERVTSGEVPAVSWLGTELGRYYWNVGHCNGPRSRRNELPEGSQAS